MLVTSDLLNLNLTEKQVFFCDFLQDLAIQNKSLTFSLSSKALLNHFGSLYRETLTSLEVVSCSLSPIFPCCDVFLFSLNKSYQHSKNGFCRKIALNGQYFTVDPSRLVNVSPETSYVLNRIHILKAKKEARIENVISQDEIFKAIQSNLKTYVRVQNNPCQTFKINTIDKNSRFYSEFTNWRKEERSSLYFVHYGKPVEFDMSTTFPSILCEIFQKMDRQASKEWKKLLSLGFYEQIQAKWADLFDETLDRETIKSKFAQYLNHSFTGSKMFLVLECLVPFATARIETLRAIEGHWLSNFLMRQEQMIMKEVYERLSKKNIPFFCVHDAVFVPSCLKNQAKSIILEVSKQFECVSFKCKEEKQENPNCCVKQKEIIHQDVDKSIIEHARSVLKDAKEKGYFDIFEREKKVKRIPAWQMMKKIGLEKENKMFWQVVNKSGVVPEYQGKVPLFNECDRVLIERTIEMLMK